MPEHVILVDENDRPLGISEKMSAHRDGKLHRAFSIFVFNDEGELLLQRRALNKYHSSGLWTNTCCSHPRPGEPVLRAATRRLKEEMGIDVALSPLFVMQYRARVSRRLIESEVVHAFSGCFEGTPEPESSEVSDWRWISLPDLCADIDRRPERYTIWFRYFRSRHWPAICQVAAASAVRAPDPQECPV